jgi:ABC-type cobalamin/Fe3+-siderophores transport system ATPase subunit
MAINDNSVFPHGTRWLRADFHLHTRVDNEFSYSGDDDYYLSNYMDALEKAGIAVGIITNHNKFDFDEFKALRRTANKKSIFLLPGVELSVNDGANGIHTLIVFSEEWMASGQNYISPFITSMFPGKSPNEYQNENGRSDKNILQVVEELEKTGRDYFLVFAHVEQQNGLWKEISGGKLSDFSTKRYETVKRRTLGFQKVRTRDKRDKVHGWLENWYPAEVEGSDCKAIDQIGKGNPCYLKIGDFTFGTVKYALLDHVNRLAAKLDKHKHSRILSVSFDGGVLDGKTIRLSPELNTLIGIRGSGKSSILETVRYVFDIPFGEKALDTDYKRQLVDHVLGSGGKITVQAVDRRGQRYEIRRINKEMSDVYINGVIQPGISIRETILHKPIYFGQKDLSATGEGFEKDLVEKLVGEKLVDIRSSIDTQRQKVSELVDQLKKLSNTEEKKKEYENKKQDAEFRLKFYKKHGVEEKLQKQVDFDADSRKCSKVVSFIQTYLADLEEFINQCEDDLKNQRAYTSKQNKDFFEGFFTLYDKLIASFSQIKKVLSDGSQVLTKLKGKAGEFEKLKDSLKEEFAEIERRLSEQLRQSGVQAIRPDEFRQLRKTVDQASQMLKVLDTQESSRKSLKQELLSEIALLNDLWLEEYKEIQTELDKVNNSHSSLEITAEFKGDKATFVAFMKDVFRGSRIRETTFTSVVKAFSDFGAMYKDFDKVKTEVGVSAQIFEEYFIENLSAFLTWQVPNRFTIEYRGKELKHHSLGQRASALILFVLSQQENDVFIIDQPEDDLDNQTIYEDVIKLIRSLKPKTQFIFATHNANFPVLGDAEQIISCSYSDDLVHVTSGSIDCPKLQQEIIDIMEGGEEAFRQRKRRYEIWKPQSS